jgi:hypothetical protein
MPGCMKGIVPRMWNYDGNSIPEVEIISGARFFVSQSALVDHRRGGVDFTMY